MKPIIKNKASLSFFKQPVELLQRSFKPMPNIEVLRCYRDVMRMTRRFTWANEDGEPWEQILRKTARAEFEAIRSETDTVKIAQFLITWREAIAKIHEKVNTAQMGMQKHIDETRTDREMIERNDYIKDSKY